MRRRVPILLCVLLLCSVLVGAVPVAGQQQPDGTHLEVQLQANGDADWRVAVRIPIADDRDRDAFEAFAARFEGGEEDLALGETVFERAAQEASTASGRPMSITSVQRDSEVVAVSGTGDDIEAYGELRVEFTWESFAREGDNGTLYVDDAFDTTDGTWLPGLGADQTLTIRAPPGYAAPTTSPIGAEGGDLHWEGPMTFEPGYFEIVYEPRSVGPVETGGLPTALVVGALLLSGAALVLGLYLLFARRWRDEDESAEETPVSTPGDATNRGPEPGEPPTPGEAATTVPADSPAASEDEEPDLDLLSDEERVEHLLEASGGRMKQATIVKETGWSNAKVSQLLSAMDEEGRIDKLRIGRENLISLPGEGVGELEEDDESE